MWQPAGNDPCRILDDRGESRQVQNHLITLTETRTAGGQKFTVRWWHALVLLFEVWFLYSLVGKTTWTSLVRPLTSWADWMSILAVAGVVLCIGIAARLPSRRQPVAPQVAALLEWGLCGGCGYDLQPIPVAADHCVVCPECGCAWNRERLTRRAPGISPEDAANGAIAQYEQLPKLVGWWEQPHADDRGQPARIADETVLGSSPMFGGGRARGILRRGTAHTTRMRVLLGTAVFTMGVLVLAGCAASSRAFRRSDEAIYVGFVGVVISLAGIGVACVSTPRAKWRRLLLSEGLCPSCGSVVVGLPTEFDGCVRCLHCQSHWNGADIGALGPVERFCRKCEYDLTQLSATAPCPECGLGAAWSDDALSQPYPGAVPVCSACGDELPGPGRVCTHCLHQAGWEWK